MAATALWLASGDPRWAELLQHAAHDTYHLPSYHALAETMGEGEARLFAYAEGERFVALPLLLRPVAGTDGLRDATSVYGYAGPVISALPPEPELLARFREALRRAATAERIVAVFSRLHPLLDQTGILTGLGDLRPHGSTVSIDLTLPEEQQIALYSQNHRRNITRLARHGFECYLDDSYESLTRSSPSTTRTCIAWVPGAITCSTNAILPACGSDSGRVYRCWSAATRVRSPAGPCF